MSLDSSLQEHSCPLSLIFSIASILLSSIHSMKSLWRLQLVWCVTSLVITRIFRALGTHSRISVSVSLLELWWLPSVASCCSLGVLWIVRRPPNGLAKPVCTRVHSRFSKVVVFLMAAALANPAGISAGKRVFLQYVGFDSWHERIALSHVHQNEWIVATPDFDLYSEQLDAQNVDFDGIRIQTQDNVFSLGIPPGRAYQFRALTPAEMAQLRQEGTRLPCKSAMLVASLLEVELLPYQQEQPLRRSRPLSLLQRPRWWLEQQGPQ
eukprot:TRINITY_DN14403_c0_g1_i2.p1 TRINITY_DN14403_c0_g1~~TRINITY_DN14403_c0_g1_i2.p1  ORF type:complete len:266 (+),score=21.49 TRINITY_DN14403_c0_g1_i2:54-851(+)